jgi:hypothetical protein
MVAITAFTRVNSDGNGNPRYVCHYTNLTMPTDRDADVTQRYNLALFRAKALGGKRFHTKQYAGGIVFQSYNLADTCNRINKLIGAA